MNFYPHNIGDFAAVTQYLDDETVGLFVRLLDRYMSTEKPIKTDWVNLAFRGERLEKAMALLNALFDRTEEGWIYAPMVEFINDYQAKAERNRVNGRKGGRPKKNQNPKETQVVPSGFSNETQNEPKKTLTNNQEPITNNQIVNNPLTPLQGEKGETAIASNVGSKEKERKRGTRLTLEKLPDDWRAYCEQEDPELDPDRVWADFRDYWTSRAGSGAIKLDWERTWQTNVRSYRDAPDWKRKPVLKPQSNEIDYSGWLTGDLG